MQDAFLNFIESPSRESYLRIREFLIALDVYDPYSDDLNTIGTLINQQQFDEANEAIAAAMPNLLLSPRAHWYAAIVYEEQGNEEHAQIEQYMMTACFQGILSTGDGSYEQPFIICRTSDEHDVLSYLGKEMQQQSLHNRDSRHFDQLDTKDGESIWFDITEPYKQMGILLTRKMQGR